MGKALLKLYVKARRRLAAMRTALSDPCLIKPSKREFLDAWNASNVTEDDYLDDLNAIQIHIEEIDELEEFEEMTALEKWRMRKRAEINRFRKMIIDSANQESTASKHGFPSFIIVEHNQEKLLYRSVSAPDFGQMKNRIDQKRVSFSMLSTNRAKTDRGILRKVSPTGLELGHIDYQTFSAWRRGSLMTVDPSTDRFYSDEQQLPVPRKLSQPFKRKTSTYELVVGSVLSCFHRRISC